MAIGNITSCRNRKQIQVEVYLRFSKNSFIMIFYMFSLIISQRIHLNSNEQDWKIGIGVVEICTDNLWYFMSFNVRMRIEEGNSKNQLHQSYLGLFLAILLQAKQSYKAAKPSVMRIPNHKKKVGPFPSPPLWFLFFSFHSLMAHPYRSRTALHFTSFFFQLSFHFKFESSNSHVIALLFTDFLI